MLLKCFIYETKYVAYFFGGCQQSWCISVLYTYIFFDILFCWSKKCAGWRILRLAAMNQHAKKQIEKQNANHAPKTMTENMKICRLPGRSPQCYSPVTTTPPSACKSNAHICVWYCAIRELVLSSLSLNYLLMQKAEAKAGGWKERVLLGMGIKRIAAGVKNTQTKSICASRR